MPNITGDTRIQITLIIGLVIGVAGISFQGGRLTNRVDANEMRINELRKITEKLTDLASSSKQAPNNHSQTIRLNASELGDLAREILKSRGELP